MLAVCENSVEVLLNRRHQFSKGWHPLPPQRSLPVFPETLGGTRIDVAPQAMYVLFEVVGFEEAPVPAERILQAAPSITIQVLLPR